MKKIDLTAVATTTPEAASVTRVLELILQGQPRPNAGVSTAEVMERMNLLNKVRSAEGMLLLEEAEYTSLKAWTEAYEWALATPELAICLRAIINAETAAVELKRPAA